MKTKENIIYAFDESRQNVTAMRKNAAIAGVKNLVEVQKYELEELDVRYGEKNFDYAVFYITSKDERKINELYYQAAYVLKKGGVLGLIGRETWDLSISEKFKLVKKVELVRGEGRSGLWVLERK